MVSGGGRNRFSIVFRGVKVRHRVFTRPTERGFNECKFMQTVCEGSVAQGNECCPLLRCSPVIDDVGDQLHHTMCRSLLPFLDLDRD